MQNKTIIVTGAAAGIGLATSLRFARAGTRVLGLDRNPAIVDICREIPNFTGISCDLTDSAKISATLNNLGADNIDGLINNAGINPISDFFSRLQIEWICYRFRELIYQRPFDKKKFADIMLFEFFFRTSTQDHQDIEHCGRQTVAGHQF